MLKKYTIKVCINIEFVKDPTNSQKNITELASSIQKMTEHLAAATDVAEYINKPQDQQKFPLYAILRTYYGDKVKVGVNYYPKGKTVYTVPYLTITEEEIKAETKTFEVSGFERVQFVRCEDLEYEVRVFENENGMEVMVAPIEIKDTLLELEKTDTFAQYLAQHTCFFATPKQMKLPNEDLYELAYGEIIQLQPTEEKPGMEWEMIEFKGVEYKCRLIPDQEKNGEDESDYSLTIAPHAMLDFMDVEGHMSLDETICYYATPDQMELSDVDLYNEIYK